MDGRITRRLPSWMSAPPADGEICQSKSSVSCRINNETSKEDAVSTLEEADAEELKAEPLPECEKKRGKRKLLEHGEASDAMILSKESKIAKRVGEAAPTKSRRRRRKATSPPPPDDGDGNEESEIACSSGVANEDDDVELTEEDLLSIANEYIAADEDSKKQKVVSGEFPPRTVAAAAATAAATAAAAATATATADDVGKVSDSGDWKSSSESEKVVVVTLVKKTGDAAQDMLNLLLGPLLLTKTKSVCGERKDDLLSNKVKVSRTDTDVVVGEAVPFINKKKKSSLKDMFLS